MSYTKSQKIKNAYKAYMKSNATKLSDVYTTWSDAKEEAFAVCKEIAANMGGGTPYIVSYNTYGFSVAFFADGTNDEPIFVYITPSHIYYCFESDLD